MADTKLPQKKYEAMWDVGDAVPYNNGRMIARAHGMRPYIHINRSPNNLRKPSSDLKLIALTKVSERSKRIVIAPPLAQRQGPPKAAPTENNSFNYVWANAQAFKPDHKKQNPTGGRKKKG